MSNSLQNLPEIFIITKDIKLKMASNHGLTPVWEGDEFKLIKGIPYSEEIIDLYFQNKFSWTEVIFEDKKYVVLLETNKIADHKNYDDVQDFYICVDRQQILLVSDVLNKDYSEPKFQEEDYNILLNNLEEFLNSQPNKHFLQVKNKLSFDFKKLLDKLDK